MDKYIVTENYTIKEVMEKFEENHDRVVVVVNSEMMAIGIISQGDIIKALVSGIDIFTNVTMLLRSNFIYMQERNLDKAYKIIRNRKITMIPILDQKFRIVSVITLDDIFNYLENKK